MGWQLNSNVCFLSADEIRVFPLFWSVEASIGFISDGEPVLSSFIEQIERASARVDEDHAESFDVCDVHRRRDVVV